METDRHLSPNDILIPVYDNDELTYITPPEYYVRFFGKALLDLIANGDG